MAGFDHTPAPQAENESVETSARNSRYGIVLFFIYSSAYGLFVLLNAFAPKVMEREVFGGVNLAIVYGLVLIVLAFVMAMLYGWLCRNPVASKVGEE